MLTSSHSLRRRLLGMILAAILLAATLLGAGAYHHALRDADTLFDMHLQRMAHSLRAGPSPSIAGDPSFGQEGFDVFVQIWGPDGTQVFRSARSTLPPRAVLGFSDAIVDGTRYRVYSMETPLRTVQIAQDMDAREARARALALRATVPMVLVAPLLMLAVGWIITRSLAPVERLRGEVAHRADDDLSPLAENGLPDEVRPLVRELNLLFGRVGEAFDAQKHFVADAAHELRSPLTALKLQVAALRRADADSAREAATERLEQGIDRAIRLVNQLLVLARQEAGTENDARPVAVDLRVLAGECIAAALPRAQARGIDLGLMPGDAVAAQGHPEALRILLGNLIDNAIKYAPEGGRVDISAGAQAGGAVLAVEDDGPGIAEAERERAFDRFYRAAGAETEGSGLGLAIVHAVAKRHGADVRLARSERLGGLRAEVRFAR